MPQLSATAKFLLRKGAAYKRVFQGPEGELVLEDLMKFCLVGSDVHVPGDPLETAYNAGRRRVGLRIASLVGMDERRAIAVSQPVLDEDEGAAA